jgi:hypothetical protein
MVIQCHKRLCIWLIVFLFASITGCIKEEIDSSEIDASLDLKSVLAVPIGFSHLSLEDYLTDSLPVKELIIDKDGFMRILYSTPVDSGVMGDIFSVNDISAGNSVLNNTGMTISLTMPGTSIVITDSVDIPVTSTQSGSGIDSIKLLNGIVNLDVTSSNLTGTVTFSIPGLKQNGIPFTVTRNLTDPDFQLNLSGYSLIPSHNVSESNFLRIKIVISLQNPSGPVAAGSQVIGLQTSLTGLQYQTIYGDFSGYLIDFPHQRLATPFFSQLSDGEIVFADPQIRLYFENSAGVPFGIYFRRIEAIKGASVLPLTGAGVPVSANPEIIGYPLLAQEGLVVSDSLVLNAGNSNLSDFIASNPDSIVVEASASITNPGSHITGFIRNDSRYKVTAEFELPLWGRADILLLLDTLEFDYLATAMPPPEEIERLIVRTSITNSFPIGAAPQIYLLNENRMIIDSLFTGTEKINGASDKTGDGKADPAKQAAIDIDLPRTKIDNLFETRYIIIKGRLVTTDFPSKDIKLYSTYFLDYNVGLIAQLKVRTGK